MINNIVKILFVLGSIVAVTVVALLVLGWGALPVLLLLIAAYSWVVFTYYHYRFVRQEELLHLIGTAAEAGSPIGPALWAFLDDRPASAVRELWVALSLSFVLPGYYWFWHRRHSFDRRLERVALLLESGAPLSTALWATPGVAAPETVLAAAVGESTGRLAVCLRNAPRWRLATVWLETVPRLIYPLALLLFINASFCFLMIFIAPKFERIFYEFKMTLPETTQQLFSFGRSFVANGGGVVLGLVGLGCVVALLYFSATARWFCPGIGRLYRMHVQSRLLRMLGILLEVERPLPEALAMLADSGYFIGVGRRRLLAVRRAVEQGEPLAPTLRRYGLLPARMVALLQAAERARNLPWALGELGEYLAKRTAKIMRQASLAFFPLAVIGAGILVAIVALGYFLPLIKMLTELSK
jgi:type II secretory pathway component PulF